MLYIPFRKPTINESHELIVKDVSSASITNFDYI